MAYLDAAQDRVAAAGRAAFINAVEAARMGWIFAQPAAQKQYDRWRFELARQSGHIVGTTIEQLAREFPDHVAQPH